MRLRRSRKKAPVGTRARVPVRVWPYYLLHGVRAWRAPELVLFVLWNAGLAHEKRLIGEIFARVSPLGVFEVEWPVAEMRDRLSALYGRAPETLHHKEDEVGHGPFLVLLGVDHRPTYTVSARGKCLSNAFCYGLKQRERARGSGNHLHASDTERDALRFAERLLGRPAGYFLDLKETSLQNRYRPFLKDVAALFAKVNDSGLKYVVLRNWESLPEGLKPGHGDVDLLVESVPDFLALFPEIIKFPSDACRVQHRLPLQKPWYRFRARNILPIDLRHVGDGYYGTAFERQILERRVMSVRGFFTPEPADHFWSLLYHAVFHKPRIGEDYKVTLRALGRGIEGWSDRHLEDPEACAAFVRKNMEVTRPRDRSVYWKPDRP